MGTNHGGVNFGRRLPPIGGQYSTPINIRPGFAWLDEQGIQPAVCLYFTDMECSSYPDVEPGFPTIWVNYSSPPDDWNREPWGERIDIVPNRGALP